MGFQEELSVKTQEAEAIIKRRFSQYVDACENPFVSTVTDAMKYSIFTGGKRLRPVLMREVFQMIRGADRETSMERTEALEVFMTALETIHTYSLVHDDLPAMDNDALRRGRATTWKVYGDGMGILAGDALMNAAFEMVFQVMEEQFSDGKQYDGRWWSTLSRCGCLLARKSCVDGMLGGQVADVESEKKSIPMTMERITFIHVKKTAALIEAAMCIGALLAGADEETVLRLERIAQKVGIAFQIQDDILDVEGDSAELGKPVGSDAQSGKATYVTLTGLQEAKRAVKKYSDEAAKELSLLPGDHAFLEALIHYLIDRRK